MAMSKSRKKKVFSDTSSCTDYHLQQLPASKELISHYREKLSALNSEYDELSARVDECRSLFETDSRIQQELVQRNAEVSRLQQAVSDLQVYVFEEREQALKLYAENDQLKLRQLEDRKKIELLLSLSGTTEDEVTFFLTSKQVTVVPQRFKPQKNLKPRKGKSNTTEDSVDQSERGVGEGDAQLLMLKVQALQAQLAEQTQLYRDETSALLQDRELVRGERVAEQVRHEQQIQALNSRLEQSQKKVLDLTAKLVEVVRDLRGHEAGWESERNQLLKNLKLCKEQLGEVFPSSGTVLPGAGLRSARSCGELSVLKEQLTERDRMLTIYQEQIVSMEEEVTRLRNLAETSKAQFKDRVQKMAGQVTYLRNKYNELDRRRMLEAEGFRTDIRLMRSRLRELERGFNKINSRSGLPRTASKSNLTEFASTDCGLLSTARDTVERARQLEQELKHIHNKVMSLESELKYSGKDC